MCQGSIQKGGLHCKVKPTRTLATLGITHQLQLPCNHHEDHTDILSHRKQQFHVILRLHCHAIVTETADLLQSPQNHFHLFTKVPPDILQLILFSNRCKIEQYGTYRRLSETYLIDGYQRCSHLQDQGVKSILFARSSRLQGAPDHLLEP